VRSAAGSVAPRLRHTSVALAASGQGRDVTVLTSDVDDLKRFLTDSAVDVEAV